MRIESLYLKNFRNVVEQTYTFNPHFTVLIGINGRGKSTWLHALRIACGCYLLSTPETKNRHVKLDEVRVSNNGSYLVSNTPVIIEASGYFPEYDTEIIWRRRVVEGKSGTSYSNEDVGKIRVLGKTKYDKMKAGSDDLDLPVIAFFGTSRVHGAGRHRSPRIGRQIFKEGYHSWYEMRSSIFRYESWLATYYTLVRQGKEYAETESAFWNAITTANPYITEIEFLQNEIWLRIQMDDYTSEHLPLHLHSDGVIAFTEMVAELAYRCIVLNGNKLDQAITGTSGVVLIDELDLHLHPNWQRHVVSDIKRAFPKIQFVATTHSPFIVQSLESSELINLDNDFGHFNPEDLTIGKVATEIMGVKDIRSDDFDLRYKKALNTFSEIDKDKKLTLDDYQKISKNLGQFLKDETNDPEFKAYIEKTDEDI